MLSLELNREQGILELNNQLLQDQDYLEVIKYTIGINYEADEQLLWETIKLDIF